MPLRTEAMPPEPAPPTHGMGTMPAIPPVVYTGIGGFVAAQSSSQAGERIP